MKNELTRFDLIMTRLDAWAVDNAGWDCRDDAANELAFCLDEYPDWSDDRLLNEAINAWLAAE